MTGNRPAIDGTLLRETLGCFPTGVVVVTTCGDDGKPVGMTVNSFSSVSLDPPLILWSISLDAPSLGAFRRHPSFVINILSNEQKSLCDQFAQPLEDKFAGVDWTPGFQEAPVINDALAVLQCRTHARYAGGDHEIMLGEVIHMHSTDKTPLIFHRGKFPQLA